jgi:cellulose synthase (UDP-forming)
MRRLATALGWLSATIVVVLVATAPVGVETQAAVGIGVILAMMVLRRLGHGSVERHAYLALGTLVVLRYVWWRTTETLPPIDDPVGFGFGLALWLAEMFCVAMLFVSLFVVADPIRRAPARRLADADCPSVDVFVPTYNESTELVAATLAAAVSMDWPADRLKVHLLDDGATDQKRASPDPVVAAAAERRGREMRALAEGFGAIYLTREKNVSAKAGNLNAALASTSGDLVAVFDADHAPTREFLRETVGHFADDPRLFLVQTPHFFLNPDPIEKNLGTFARMPSENEMFYSVVQCGLDRWNAAFFCGSAAVLRRTALDEAGGFSGITITEDCETALDLHSRGWRSRFVDKPMIAGLQPETLAQFIGQRSRWCRGMIQILLLKNPLLRRGLTPAQRIAYLSSALFWLFPLPRIAFIAAPLLFVFFGVRLYVANLPEFFAYTVVYMIANMLMQNHLYGRVRWPWVSELYEYVQMPWLARAIVSVLIAPRKPTFAVTDKGVVTERTRLSEIAAPYFVVFAVLALGSALAFGRFLADPETNDPMLIAGLWNSFNLVLAGVGLGVATERPERRRSQRLGVSHRAVLEVDGRGLDVVIDDISVGGVRLRSLDPSRPFGRIAGATTLLIAPGDGAEPVRVPVRIRRTGADDRGAFLGLAFGDLTPAAHVAVATVMFGRAAILDGLRSRRRIGRSLFVGTVQLLGWAVAQSGRALGAVLDGRNRRSTAAATAVAVPVPVAVVTGDHFDAAEAHFWA